MFIKIGKQRIKLASIGEFKECGQVPSNNVLYHIEVKISGRNRTLFFNTEEEYSRTVKYLDKALKVIEV